MLIDCLAVIILSYVVTKLTWTHDPSWTVSHGG